MNSLSNAVFLRRMGIHMERTEMPSSVDTPSTTRKQNELSWGLASVLGNSIPSGSVLNVRCVSSSQAPRCSSTYRWRLSGPLHDGGNSSERALWLFSQFSKPITGVHSHSNPRKAPLNLPLPPSP